jgi:hypothetical protein
MTNWKFWILAILLAWFGRDGAHAQQKQPVTSVQPDCMVFFGFNAASSGAQAATNSTGTSILIDNRQVGCYGWTVAVNSFGFTAESLLFQSAPDNAAGTGPGTWAAFAGTLIACTPGGAVGINPNTATTQAITCGTGYFPWLRMNLTSITGAGAVSGVLYGFKVNSASRGTGGGGLCPGGLNGQVQYDNAGNCAGTSGATATATRLLIANGTGAAPGISFADGTTGFFRNGAFSIGTLDSQLIFSASGVTTNVLHDNDTWHCREGEGGQRGICEVFSSRVTNNARFFDLTDTFINWGDPAGGGAGNRVGVGRFTSEGATATAVHTAVSDGGTHVLHEALSFESSGCTFAGIATCSATANGTFAYCSDCTVTSSIDNTCVGGGTGAAFDRIAGAYKCRL